jgi:hypothetical protein
MPMVEMLLDVADIEQTLSTGETDSRSKIDSKYLNKTVRTFLENIDVDSRLKNRVLALCAVHYSVKDLNLISDIIDNDASNVLNGVNLLSPSDTFTKNRNNPMWRYMPEGWQEASTIKRNSYEKILNSFIPQNVSPDFLNRHVPMIEKILIDILTKHQHSSIVSLSPQFTVKTDKVLELSADSILNFKKFKPHWASSFPKNPEDKSSSYLDNGPRIIFFILGGISLTEIRSIHRLSNRFKREIIIGIC